MNSSLTISEYSTNSILVSVGGSNQMGLELKDFFTEQGGFYNNKLGGFLFHKSKKDMLRRIIESGSHEGAYAKGRVSSPEALSGHTPADFVLPYGKAGLSGIEAKKPDPTGRGGWFLTKDEYLALIGRIEFLELALKKSQREQSCPYGARDQRSSPNVASFKAPKSPQRTSSYPTGGGEAGTKPDRTEKKRGNNEIIKRFLSKN